MENALEIYRGHEESRSSVIARAVDLAKCEGTIVIIAAYNNTPPVKVRPGDTHGPSGATHGYHGVTRQVGRRSSTDICSF